MVSGSLLGNNNLFNGPTDCPTREKNFWNGDAAVFESTAFWFMDSLRLYQAWTKEGRKIYCDAAAWIDEDFITPWMLYLYYGDTLPLKENFKKIKELVDRRIKESKDYFYSGEEAAFIGDHAVPHGCNNVPKALFNHMFFCYSVLILSKIARVLEYNDDYSKYSSLIPLIAAAVNNNPEYFSQSSNIYGNGNQGSQLLPVAFGVAQKEKIPAIIDSLERMIKKRNYRLDTGASCTTYLLPVLTEYGKLETTWSIAVQKEYPSWGHMLSTGATTMTELWDGLASPINYCNSMDHFFKGTIGHWLFEYLVGIKYDEDCPGFKKIICKPFIPKKLEKAGAEYLSSYGLIKSEWRKSNDKIFWEVVIPPNTSATIYIPCANEQISESGKPLNTVNSIIIMEKSYENTVITIGLGSYEFAW